MDIKELEYGVRKFFEFCRNNPEYCPHDYERVKRVGIKKAEELDIIWCERADEKANKNEEIKVGDEIEVWNWKCKICGMMVRKIERVKV